MKIETYSVPPAGLRALLSDLQADPPSFAALHHRVGSVGQEDLQGAAEMLPALHCASSCFGVMDGDGLQDAGLFVLRDPSGDYGTACAAFDAPVAAVARRALEEALSHAGRPGEVPDLVWLACTPGHEEEVLAGIQSNLGQDVPIIGGSAADDTVSGDWSVSDGRIVTQQGLVVSVLFCSTPISFAYQNGYAPSFETGIVTRAQGRRIYEVDGRPAAEAYTRWTSGAMPAPAGEGQNILSQATLWPLGRPIGTLGGVPSYLLAHPSHLHPDGSIELFAEVQEGEEMTQMRGDVAALAARAGRVAGFALSSAHLQPDDVAGALLVYCGGCRLAVGDRIEEVQNGVAQALAGRPFLGTFTFGEQGPVFGAGNRHGNLMISCIAFGRAD